MKTVSIVGLGWLGFPLAQHLKRAGWNVKGSKRTLEGGEEMRLRRVVCYPLDITPQLNASPDDLALLLEADSLIINIPPSAHFFEPQAYVEGVQRLVNEAILQGVNHFIFISSISIFPQQSATFDENSPIEPDSEVGKALLELEQWLANLTEVDCDILRLGGLVGLDRHPVYHLAGKSVISGGSQPVNLVHLTDCILAIESLLETAGGFRCYHLVASQHPHRQVYYQTMAKRFGLPTPEFEAEPPFERIILANKICEELGFIYQYPDPYQMDLANEA